MNNFKKLYEKLTEGKLDYVVMNKSYNAVVDEILAFIKKNGYEVSDDEIFSQITTAGPPKTEVSKRISLDLTKNGKPQRRRLEAQVYKMKGGTFELNMYLT